MEAKLQRQNLRLRFRPRGLFSMVPIHKVVDCLQSRFPPSSAVHFPAVSAFNLLGPFPSSSCFTSRQRNLLLDFTGDVTTYMADSGTPIRRSTKAYAHYSIPIQAVASKGLLPGRALSRPGSGL